METAIIPGNARCTNCGAPPDPMLGLCLACLIQCATEIGTSSCGGENLASTEDSLVGSYQVLGEIGRGGMGVIYQARQIHTGRLVAMKMLRPDIVHQPEMVARFRREAKAAANLDHPHILPIHEVNEEADGAPFFTMKLATGGSLKERQAAFRGHPRGAVALLASVARAAAHAHEKGVLHRDLKPANILFDAQDRPMVSDFGLAAWLHEDRDLSSTRIVVGTPGYLPPEYLKGRPDTLRPSADVYSLGVILFELLAGRLPFECKSGLESLQLAASKRAPLLRTLVPSLDRDLETICVHCLEADPAMRYGSAAALAEDLERWLAGRPILARRTPFAVQSWKLIKRHPAISASTALCFLLGLCGVILNGLRQTTETKLQLATAYDRTVSILPIEDLDELSANTPAAREATQRCMADLQDEGQFVIKFASTAPDPLPHDKELLQLSRDLKSRYLFSGTVRKGLKSGRMVFRITDALGERASDPKVVELINAENSNLRGEISSLLVALKPIKKIPINPGHESARSRISNVDLSRAVADYIRTGEHLVSRRNKADVELAIDAYEKALKLDPENATALALLATALSARSDYGENEYWINRGVIIAERAAKISPLSAPAQRSLSIIYYLQGDGTAAREHALTAFELQPDNSASAGTVAETMFMLGSIDFALLWTAKACRRSSDAAEYSLSRGDYCAAIDDWESATVAYSESLQFHPDLPDGHLGLAYIDHLRGQTENALKRIRTLHDRFPSDPVVTFSYASLEFHCGDARIAEQIYHANASDDDAGLNAYLGVRARSALGYLALKRGDPVGRDLVEKAAALDRKELGPLRANASLLFELAANLSLLGQKKEALNTLWEAARFGAWTHQQMRLDARMDSLRNTSEFAEILFYAENRIQAMRMRWKSK